MPEVYDELVGDLQALENHYAMQDAELPPKKENCMLQTGTVLRTAMAAVRIVEMVEEGLSTRRPLSCVSNQNS